MRAPPCARRVQPSLQDSFIAAETSFDRGEIADREVLPPYGKVRRDLDALRLHPERIATFFEKLHDHAARKHERFKLFVEGLRQQDRERLRRYEEKMGESQALARELLLKSLGFE